MKSTADSEAKKAWDRENKVMIHVPVMRRTESEILAKLESVPNKSRYIKDLIRRDIAASVTSTDEQ